MPTERLLNVDVHKQRATRCTVVQIRQFNYYKTPFANKCFFSLRFQVYARAYMVATPLLTLVLDSRK